MAKIVKAEPGAVVEAIQGAAWIPEAASFASVVQSPRISTARYTEATSISQGANN